MSDLTRSKRYRLKQTISLLGSVYSVVLLMGLLVSVILQFLPIFENPIVAEVARYSMVVLASVLMSYIVTRYSESQISDRMTQERSELCEYLECLNIVLVVDMRISQYLISMLGDVFFRKKKGKLEDFDYVIRQIKKKEAELERIKSKLKRFPDLHTFSTEGCVGAIIKIANFWEIPFEKLAHYFLQKFGKEQSKRLVKKEKILRSYGKEELSMWKSITE